MDLPQKRSFSAEISEQLDSFVNNMTQEGSFFGDTDSFPNEKLIERGKIYLWNYIGEAMLNKHLGIDSEETFSEDDMEQILINVVLQTNLDSLMNDNLIDSIENENGEMVYFMTEKGRELHKFLGDEDVDNS